MDRQEVLNLYFRNLIPNEPFKDSSQEKAVFLKFLDLLLVLSVYQAESAPEEARDRVGVLLPDAELMRSFEPQEIIGFSDFNTVRDVYLELLKKVNKTAEENDFGTFRGFPISAVIWSGLLSHFEILAFIMALSTSLNRKYEKMYAILSQSSGDSARPTVGLCKDLARFYLTPDERKLSELFDTDSFLNKVLLTSFDGQILPELARPLVLRQQTLLYLEDHDETLGDISLCGEYIYPEYALCDVHEPEEDELFKVYSYAVSSDEDSVIFLTGDRGIGKRFVVGRLLDKIDKIGLAVDIGKILSLSEGNRIEVISGICVKLVLFNELLYLHNLPETRECDRQVLHIISFFQDYFDVVIVGVEKPPSKELEAAVKGSIYRIELREVDTAAQKLLWGEALEKMGVELSEDIDIDELVSKYTLNPGRIMQAVKGASSLADGNILKKNELENSIRSICSVSFGENAKRIRSPFTWDDLILEETSKELLRYACNRVRCRSKVNEDFGFGAKLPYGKGIAIVFYGPPGTGKTMAAQVLSNELSLDLYRIDLSQISSKYIGETEKNLSLVFDAARNSNAILFFDEADSLFSKRTEVSSSNDKYANAETSYLLQKIEEYSGVSILATNNLQNFDAAFKRRMTYIIPIGLPDEATRETLWNAAFPEGAPLASDVNFKILAEVLEISGSSIKNTAIEAAYRAAARDSKITMNDILDAVDLECMKIGKMGAKTEVLSKMVNGI